MMAGATFAALGCAMDRLSAIPASGRSRAHAYLVWLVNAGPWMIQAVLVINSAWLTRQLLSPEATFAGSKGWGWMAARITEDHLATITAVVATIGVTGLISRRRIVRAFAALVSSLLAGVLANGFYEANVAAGMSGTASGTYAGLTVLSWWLVANRMFGRE